MGALDSLKGFYFGIEDSYYKFAEGLESGGIPFIRYFVEPIEKSGIPSFPIFIAILLLLVLGIAWLALGATAPGTTSVKVQLMSEGRAVSNIPVTLLVPGEKAPRTVVALNGIATFQNVPVGIQAVVRVQHADYANYSKIIDVKPGLTFQATLLPAAAATQLTYLTLRVKDDRGSGLSGATISFSDPETGEFRQFTTDASGLARIDVAQADQFYPVSISKDGYAPSQYTLSPSMRLAEEISLTPADEIDYAEGGTQEPSGTVVVIVKDSDGNLVEDAQVSLFDAGAYTSIDVAHTDSEGTVNFESVTVGKRVYVNAEPPEDKVSVMNPYYGLEDAQAVFEYGDTEFRVELVTKAPSEINTLTVSITDEAGTPLSGAMVSLFSMGDNAPLGAPQETDSEGAVTFTLTPGVAAYATAWKENYLPSRSLALTAGSAPMVQLPEAIVGNYGDIEVTVNDAEGLPVSSAKVRLVYGDGFDAGIPETSTGGDGTALFTQVPAGTQLQVVASFGASKGASEVFTVSFGEVADSAKKVVVQFEPVYGSIMAVAEDVSQPTKPVAGVSFTALEKDVSVATCTAATGGSSCILKVRANHEVVIRSSAAGYGSADSVPVYAVAENTKTVKVYVLPADLVNQLNIKLVNIRPLGGFGVTAKNELERGIPYLAEFFFNIPASEKGGVAVRFGDSPNAANDLVGVTSAKVASYNASVVTTSTYNPGSGCLSESNEPADGSYYKTVSVELKNTATASMTVGVKFFVKPTAQAGSKVPIYYRAWAARGGAYSRVPADTVLGTSRTTAQREECYAESTPASYTVVEGGSICNEKACVGMLFRDNADPSKKGGRGYQAAYNEPFTIQVSAQSFVTLEPSSTYIKISNERDQNIEVGSFVKRVTPAGVSATPPVSVNATFSANPVLPAPTSKLKVEFGDARGALIEDEYEVFVDGRAGLTLDVQVDPFVMDANVEQNLKVTVLTPQGTPVTKAVIQLIESKGAPFDGQPPARLEGDGSEGLGEDGIYIFKRLMPTAPGEVTVRVTVDPKSLFKIIEIPVPVAAYEFLEFAPESVSLSGDACNTSNELVITNPLQNDVKIRYAFQGDACVDVFAGGAWAPGTVKVLKKSTARKAGTLKVLLKPAAARKAAKMACSLVFSYYVTAQQGYETSGVTIPADLDCPIAIPTAFSELPAGYRPCIEDQEEACGGDYAPKGTCKHELCPTTEYVDPDTGVLERLSSYDVQQNFDLLNYCALKVKSKNYGYPISSASGQPSACITGKCEVGLCSCKEAMINKYTDLMFNNLWYNYLLSRVSEEKIKFTDASGGFVLRFGEGGTLSSMEVKPPVTVNQQQAGPDTMYTSGWDAQASVQATPQPAGGTCGADLCFTISEIVGQAALALVLDNSQGQTPTCNIVSRFPVNDFEVIRVPNGATDLGVFRALDVFSLVSTSLEGLFGKGFEVGKIPTQISALEGQAFFLRFIGAPNGVFPTGEAFRDYTFTFSCAGGGSQFTKKVRIIAKAVPKKYAVPVVPASGSTIYGRSTTTQEPFTITSNILSASANASVTIGTNTPIKVGAGEKTTVPVTLADGSNKLLVQVGGVPIGTAADAVTVDRTKRVPDSLSELAKYDVIGNVIDSKTYAECSKTDFCVSSAGWSDQVSTEVQEALKGSMVTGAKSSVIRETPSGNTFLDALFVALYDATQAACADAEFLECAQGVKTSKTPPAAPSFGAFPGMSGSFYPAGGYGAGSYPGAMSGGMGAAGFPGFTGQYNSQCNFKVALDSICSGFFNAGSRFRSEGRATRLGAMAGTQFGTALCSIAVLQAIGAVGPGKRPVFTPAMGGGWGQAANFGINYFLKSASDEARARLGSTQFEREEITFGTPVGPDDKPITLRLPWRKAGAGGGLVYYKLDIGYNTIGTTETFVTANEVSGFPYLDCSTGTCNVAYATSEKPVLSTINKYKPVAHDKAPEPADALGVIPLWTTANPGATSLAAESSVNVFSANIGLACAPIATSPTDAKQLVYSENFQLFEKVPVGDYACRFTNILDGGRFTVFKKTKDGYPKNPVTNVTVPMPVSQINVPASGQEVLDSNPFYVLTIGEAATDPAVVIPELFFNDVRPILQLDSVLATQGAAPGQPAPPADPFAGLVDEGRVSLEGFANTAPVCTAYTKMVAGGRALFAAGAKPEAQAARGYAKLAAQALTSVPASLKTDCAKPTLDPTVLNRDNQVGPQYLAAAQALAKGRRVLVLAAYKRAVDGVLSASLKEFDLEISQVASATESLKAYAAANPTIPESAKLTALLAVTPYVMSFESVSALENAYKELNLISFAQTGLLVYLLAEKPELVAAAKAPIVIPRREDGFGAVTASNGKAWALGERGESAKELITYFLDEKATTSGLDAFRKAKGCSFAVPTTGDNIGRHIVLWCNGESRSAGQPAGQVVAKFGEEFLIRPVLIGSFEASSSNK